MIIHLTMWPLRKCRGLPGETSWLLVSSGVVKVVDTTFSQQHGDISNLGTSLSCFPLLYSSQDSARGYTFLCNLIECQDPERSLGFPVILLSVSSCNCIWEPSGQSL